MHEIIDTQLPLNRSLLVERTNDSMRVINLFSMWKLFSFVDERTKKWSFMELETVTDKWWWGKLLNVIVDWFRNVMLLITGWWWWWWGRFIVISIRSNKIIILNTKCLITWQGQQSIFDHSTKKRKHTLHFCKKNIAGKRRYSEINIENLFKSKSAVQLEKYVLENNSLRSREGNHMETYQCS